MLDPQSNAHNGEVRNDKNMINNKVNNSKSSSIDKPPERQEAGLIYLRN